MGSRAELILANRAYVDHDTPPGAESHLPPGTGGLLAALRPVIVPWEDGSGTTWIGAGRGRFDRARVDSRGFELDSTPRGLLRHRRLFFDEATWRGHYVDVANSFLWPLLHLSQRPLPRLVDYYPRPVTPLGEDWAAYRAVNSAFAGAAAEESAAATCWVHDYQLALVPAMLRSRGFGGRVGLFLHTPFPDLAVAAPFLDDQGRSCLAEFVGGMLGADLVGLQTAADVRRFSGAAAALCGAEVRPGGLVVAGRAVDIAAHPVGVDTADLLELARVAQLPPRLREVLDPSMPLVVGLERCDFTKGIPERLRAVARAFDRGARFVYAGVASPTRQGVGVYDGVDAAVTAAAREAADAARRAGGAFLLLREVIPWREVVALEREADVVFTSSLADGMNLVPLQAAVAQSLKAPGRRAVLIAGRDAGVACTFAGYEADGLVTVDPLDPEAMTATLEAALAGRPARVSDRLVDAVTRRDAGAWVAAFMSGLGGVRC